MRTLLLLALGAGLVSAEEVRSADQKEPSTTLSGRVVDSRSGQPLKAAVVRLSPAPEGTTALTVAERRRVNITPPELPAPYSAVSDAAGRFNFPNVAPGFYVLEGRKAGLIGTAYGAKTPFECGMILDISSGVSKEVTLALLPAGSISGHVLNSSFDPVDNGTVELLAALWLHGKERRLLVGQVRPNDLGEFRFGKLPPGEYYVVFSPFTLESQVSGNPVTTANISSRLVRTFHPSGIQVADAAPIAVESGSDRMAVDVVVQERRPHSIRGRLVGGQGANSAISLTPQDEDLTTLALGNAGLQRDGSFEFRNVSPGSYRITYLGASPTGSNLVNTFVTLVDADLDNVIVQVPPPARVHGRLKMSPAQPTMDFSQFHIELVSSDELIAQTLAARLQADGSFWIEGCPPGKYAVNISAPRGTYVKSLVQGGTDVPGRIISVSGTEVELDVSFARSESEVRGKIDLAATASSSTADSSGPAYFAVLPVSGAGSLPSQIYVGHTDSQGSFSVKELPPGGYKIFGFNELNLMALYNPVLIGILGSSALDLDVGENVTLNITIPVLSASQTNRLSRY